jgi:histidyl-tRNA synthetase
VPYKTELTELSQERLLTNPTRILDDKVDGLKYFVKNAPKISSFLSQDEINDQKKLEKALNELGINFIYDETMVRGLDYYTNFVFEVVSTNPGLSGQSTLIGGGRYGKLISEFGGPDASSIGLAMGIERLIMQCDFEEINIADEQNIDVVIAALSPTCEEKAIEILAILRKNNISAVCKFDQQKLIKVFNYASRINARYVAVLGEKELSNNTIVIKNQKTMAQEEISIQDIINYIH